MSEFLLEMKHITKEFPGVKALDDVSLALRAGSVHALMGENGAGKSTLMKCLFGIYEADSGEFLLNGRSVRFRTPREALDGGVAMVHQELNQALARNVSDNLWLGRYPSRFGFVAEKKMHRETAEVFSSLGMHIDPRRPMSEMPVAERQMAEIAKAVSCGARVLVLDEPTSSLNDAEVEHLFRIIGRLRDDGCGIIYISHKMEEILRISDDITVMRDGRHIATRPASEMNMDTIIRLMVGRTLENRFPPKAEGRIGPVALTVKGLTAEYAPVHDVSFSLRRGEIVGVAGLGGAGRTELLETLFGLRALAGGELLLDGKRIRNQNPRAAIRNGFALLTEERRATGIFGILSITENTVISSLAAYRRGPLLSAKQMREDTEGKIKSLRVKTPSAATKIRTLSGGNQQKVILGRWLLTKPRILLLDEPTRGIDVGAKYEIYQLIQRLAEEGRSVLMVSSEMPELLGVCDRILVMSGGRLAGEVDASTTTQEEILTLAAKYV